MIAQGQVLAHRQDVHAQDHLTSEGFSSTGQAAERWRQSWRDRQRAEAGPAEQVPRGHASVPMPLMAMQQSLGRMRAIISANKQQQDGRDNGIAFWVTILLLICLIAGLGLYIISSYLPGSPFEAAHLVPPASSGQPTLSIQGTQPESIVAGQALHLHGEHFSANDPITFLLDTTTPITNAAGQRISAQANDQGAFDVMLPVGSDWSAGTHLIQAEDSHTNQSAYLTIQVRPPGPPIKSSSDLELSLNGQPLPVLMFTAVIGQDNPGQRITLTNTSGAPLKWSASAIANNNLSWLVINNNHTSGTLDISGTDTMGISAITSGLKSTSKDSPYTGQILFTLNAQEQLTLPVQLQVSDAPAELVFSPNPIVAHLGPGGTCQEGASLTLINLGNQVISWKLGMDDNTGTHLHFVSMPGGQATIQGLLAPTGQANGQFHDTQVLALQCAGVKAGQSYHITVYANNAQWPELVLIQA